MTSPCKSHVQGNSCFLAIIENIVNESDCSISDISIFKECVEVWNQFFECGWISTEVIILFKHFE